MVRPKVLKPKDIGLRNGGANRDFVGDVILARGRTKVFGKEWVQFTEVKNQSSCSRRGVCCMLLQVKALPFKGSSSRPRWTIISLKIKVSATLPPGLLRFSKTCKN
jgi:hypothetical protein